MGIKSKDKRDVYYKMAKKNGYRARCAYKLLQIDEEYNLFENTRYVIDLCGAPGSWSQYVARKVDENLNLKIVSVDVQEMADIENVICLKEDITSPSCVQKILGIFENHKADIVLFDGAPDVIGIHDLDEYMQSKLLLNALSITAKVADQGSSFVGKMFRGQYCKYIVNHFRKFYDEVILVKPRASRSASIECFIYGKGFKSTEDDPIFLDIDLDASDIELVSCGNGPDPDLCDENVVCIINPPQEPINPPYRHSVNLRKSK